MSLTLLNMTINYYYLAFDSFRFCIFFISLIKLILWLKSSTVNRPVGDLGGRGGPQGRTTGSCLLHPPHVSLPEPLLLAATSASSVAFPELNPGLHLQGKSDWNGGHTF